MRPRLSSFLPAGCALIGLALACAAPAVPPNQPPPAATTPAAAAAAPTAVSQPQAASSPRFTVRFGGIAGVIDRALWTGEAKGYYQEQGIVLDVENFTTTVDMVAPLATGRLDAGHGAVNAGLINAVATGVPLRFVSNMSILRRPVEGVRNSYQIVVRKDLASQVRGVPDLRGMRLAINAPAAQLHAYRALSHYGMRLDDVQLENVTFPEQIAALANQAVDAAIALEPLVTFGQDRGVLEPLFDMGQAMPDYPVSMLFYAADFIQQQPEAARRFMVAYMQALRFLEDAATKRQNWAEVVQLFIANTPVKDASVYERMADSYNEPNGSIGVEALGADQEFYLQHGMQRERLNVRELVDTRFADYARQALGEYQR